MDDLVVSWEGRVSVSNVRCDAGQIGVACMLR